MIQLEDWDTDNILVSTKIYSGENNNRYFVAYVSNCYRIK